MDSFKTLIPLELTSHNQIANKLFRFFTSLDEVNGIFLSGSTATGNMDIDSDLDIGLLLPSKKARDILWQSRWDWDIFPWFHRFDADHIKDYFVIYFFEPHIKVDINLYIHDDLPHKGGAPYYVVREKGSILSDWNNMIKSQPEDNVDWSDVIHDDERIWAWLFYLYGHIHRGEYYLSAIEYPGIREVLEKWFCKLQSKNYFNPKCLEWSEYGKELISSDLFPHANKDSLKKVLLDSIERAITLRKLIQNKEGVKWKTKDEAITKITKLIEAL